MANRFVITAVGDDRPGIVAAFTAALLPLDANLEDTAMTLLEGQFAMVLVVRLPDAADTALREAIGPVAATFGLMVDVAPIEVELRAPAGQECSLTVYGADRPGIVHAIAQALADEQVNIVDLATRVIGRDAETPVYAMLLDLRLPATVGLDQLRSRLDAVAGDLGVDCNLRAIDADIL